MSTFNVHEWNRKRRLGENEETLKEAPIFDEIDMMVKESNSPYECRRYAPKFNG
jgi:hypothetical protein